MCFPRESIWLWCRFLWGAGKPDRAYSSLRVPGPSPSDSSLQITSLCLWLGGRGSWLTCPVHCHAARTSASTCPLPTLLTAAGEPPLHTCPGSCGKAGNVLPRDLGSPCTRSRWGTGAAEGTELTSGAVGDLGHLLGGHPNSSHNSLSLPQWLLAPSAVDSLTTI